ncbi:hypothetical protein ACP70R_002826 [Stipagrostis hirtigluma subsp. patula]
METERSRSPMRPRQVTPRPMETSRTLHGLDATKDTGKACTRTATITPRPCRSTATTMASGGGGFPDLPGDIVRGIADRLGDEHRPRMRAICSASSAALPAEPQPWILLQPADHAAADTAARRDQRRAAGSFSVLSLPANSKLSPTSPVVRGLAAFPGARCVGAAHGWLALVGADLGVTLLNPVTGRTVSLPPLTRHPMVGGVQDLDDGRRGVLWLSWLGIRPPSGSLVPAEEFRDTFVQKLVFSPRPREDDYFAVVVGDHRSYAAYARAGEASWTTLRVEGGWAPDANPVSMVRDVVHVDGGRFVAVTRCHGRDVQIDLSVHGDRSSGHPFHHGVPPARVSKLPEPLDLAGGGPRRLGRARRRERDGGRARRRRVGGEGQLRVLHGRQVRSRGVCVRLGKQARGDGVLPRAGGGVLAGLVLAVAGVGDRVSRARATSMATMASNLADLPADICRGIADWFAAEPQPWIVLQPDDDDDDMAESDQQSGSFSVMSLPANLELRLSHACSIAGTRCVGAGHGWLALVGGDLSVTLHNPVSDHSVSLPPLTRHPMVGGLRDDGRVLWRSWLGVSGDLVRSHAMYARAGATASRTLRDAHGHRVSLVHDAVHVEGSRFFAVTRCHGKVLQLDLAVQGSAGGCHGDAVQGDRVNDRGDEPTTRRMRTSTTGTWPWPRRSATSPEARRTSSTASSTRYRRRG